MEAQLTYSILSTLIVSLMAFVGVLTLSIKKKWLEKALFILISLSAGGLLGDVFFHLLPELVEKEGGFTSNIAIMILTGIVGFYILEKFVIWHHHHNLETPDDHENHEHVHTHSLGIMNLAGDAFHNLLDGMIIGASFMISPVVGFSTTLAVILHEIPQEFGDFGVLIHSGFSVRKALFFNFLSGLVAVFGAVLVFYIGGYSETFSQYLIPLAAGSFIYIAGSDLIPELKKELGLKNSILQLLALIVGILIMFAMLELG